MMRLFFEQVNFHQKIFKDIDYSPLINTLNITLTEYSKLLKTRIATNKRRAKKKELAGKVVLEKKAKAPVKGKEKKVKG